MAPGKVLQSVSNYDFNLHLVSRSPYNYIVYLLYSNSMLTLQTRLSIIYDSNISEKAIVDYPR